LAKDCDRIEEVDENRSSLYTQKYSKSSNAGNRDKKSSCSGRGSNSNAKQVKI